jgi:hypothetical protein
VPAIDEPRRLNTWQFWLIPVMRSRYWDKLLAKDGTVEAAKESGTLVRCWNTQRIGSQWVQSPRHGDPIGAAARAATARHA